MYKLLLLLICCAALPGCLQNYEETASAAAHTSPEVVVLQNVLDGASGADKLRELISEGNVVVDFFATWCGPCKMMHPIIDQLAEKYKGQVRFVKVDVDQFSEIARGFKVDNQTIYVESYPQFFFFKNGSIVDHLRGGRNLNSFETEVKRIFSL